MVFFSVGNFLQNYFSSFYSSVNSGKKKHRNLYLFPYGNSGNSPDLKMWCYPSPQKKKQTKNQPPKITQQWNEVYLLHNISFMFSQSLMFSDANRKKNNVEKNLFGL